MKRVLLILCVVSLIPIGGFAATPASTLQIQVEIQKEVQREDLEELKRFTALADEAWIRIRRGVLDFRHAKRDGEDLESLRLRNEDLLQTEGYLLANLFEAQRLRRKVLASEAEISRTLAVIESMTGSKGPKKDHLSGTWKLVEEPGNRKGELYLSLDGTLVQGTYRIDGGWTGSMRGTLVGTRLRLERIDSQQGFTAIYYGKLIRSDGQSRIVGKWEATNLAAGTPSAGGWVAERVEGDSSR